MQHATPDLFSGVWLELVFFQPRLCGALLFIDRDHHVSSRLWDWLGVFYAISQSCQKWGIFYTHSANPLMKYNESAIASKVFYNSIDKHSSQNYHFFVSAWYNNRDSSLIAWSSCSSPFSLVDDEASSCTVVDMPLREWICECRATISSLFLATSVYPVISWDVWGVLSYLYSWGGFGYHRMSVACFKSSSSVMLFFTGLEQFIPPGCFA